jgi:hypothetical protein
MTQWQISRTWGAQDLSQQAIRDFESAAFCNRVAQDNDGEILFPHEDCLAHETDASAGMG